MNEGVVTLRRKYSLGATDVMEIALVSPSPMDDREAERAVSIRRVKSSLIRERFGKSGVKRFQENREMRDGISYKDTLGYPHGFAMLSHVL